MRGWLLIHLVADAGMFAQGLHSGGLAGMVGDRAAFRSALLTSRELLPIVTARPVDLRRHWRVDTVTDAGCGVRRHGLCYSQGADRAGQPARRLGVPALRLEGALEGRVNTLVATTRPIAGDRDPRFGG